MTLGPLEYLIVAFEGNRFSGEILTALHDAQEKGIIRVIDLLVIKKDEQGNVMALELNTLKESYFECRGCSQSWWPCGSRNCRSDRGRNRSRSCREATVSS